MACTLTAEDVNKMKVADLRAELSSRELSTSGLKKQLVERLLEAIEGSDSTGQAAGDAPELADDAEKGTDNLPSEMPAIPPANEDSVADLEGKEPTLSEEKATNGVAVSGEPSEVVKPDVNSVDPTPGFVQETKAPEDTAGLAGETGEKRKREEETPADIAVQPLNEAPVEPVAAQEEKSEQPNDPVPSAPADVDQPELKRAKLDNDSSVLPLNDAEANGGAAPSNADDIPVLPASNDVAKSVPTLKVIKGASLSSSSSKPPSSDESPHSNSTHAGAYPAEGNVHRGDEIENGHVAPEKSASKPKSLNIKGSSAKSPLLAQSDTKPLSIKGKAVQSGAEEDRMVIDERPANGDHENAPHADESDVDARPPPSASICVSNLVRPFTLPALREKLASFGEVTDFWINSIKSHCFVTYVSIDQAMAAYAALHGVTWPETVGRQLEINFIPKDTIPGLVQKEEEAGRTRLELQVTKDPETNAWQYDVAPPSAAVAGKSAAVPRGLASALPAQVRPISNNPFPLGIPAQAPSVPSISQAAGPSRGRLFDQAQGRNSGPIASGSNAIRANPSAPSGPPPRAVALREPLADRSQGREADNRREEVWRPASRAAEDLYKRTKASPALFYRPVDVVAAGRRLRDLERENRRYSQPARRLPSGVRDSYRP